MKIFNKVTETNTKMTGAKAPINCIEKSILTVTTGSYKQGNVHIRYISQDLNVYGYGCTYER